MTWGCGVMCKCELFLMALHLWCNLFLIAFMDLADTCFAFTAHIWSGIEPMTLTLL